MGMVGEQNVCSAQLNLLQMISTDNQINYKYLLSLIFESLNYAQRW